MSLCRPQPNPFQQRRRVSFFARYVTSASDEWIGELDSSVRHGVHVDVLQDTPIRSLTTTDGGDLKIAPEAWRDEARSPLADSLGRTRLSVLEEATEGGLVDIDELLETSAVSLRSPGVR